MQETSTDLEEVIIGTEIIDGIEYVDGISQTEVITDFDIEGVRVVDNRLAFENLDALTNAIEKLTDFNQESILAWSEKIGFTSLFTERERLKSLSEDEIQMEINSGLYAKYFTINEKYGDLELVMHHPMIAMFYNSEGIIQVGDYVGIILTDLIFG